jgi:methionine synthase I (cobalamin-dependent)
MSLKAQDFVGKVTLVDGAWGTELDKLGCPPGYCREEWNISHPELVEKVARGYLQAGSQIILTNTFSGNRFSLEKHNYGERTHEFNVAGGQISKKCAGEDACVFGSMGPSGKMVVTGEVTEEALFETFKEQAQALAEGGVDGIVVETMTELAEARAAVKAAKTTGLIVTGCMTYDSGKDKTVTMMGVKPEQAVEELGAAGADMIGCNCGVGIENYIQVTSRLRAATDMPIWVKANAGLPEVQGEMIIYRMTPEQFAEKAKEVVDAGANIIGGCCGTNPEFIAALSRTFMR